MKQNINKYICFHWSSNVMQDALVYHVFVWCKKAEKIISIENTPKCKQDAIQSYYYETKIQAKDNWIVWFQNIEVYHIVNSYKTLTSKASRIFCHFPLFLSLIYMHICISKWMYFVSSIHIIIYKYLQNILSSNIQTLKSYSTLYCDNIQIEIRNTLKQAATICNN